MHKKNFAVLGLGSNLGKKSKNLADAVKRLSGFCEIKAVSPVYKTESLLKDDQDSYFNICVFIFTEMDAESLLCAVKNIEKVMGRTYTGHWYTRTIDIDIIDYNRSCYKSENLVIPHPQADKRSFVLFPMQDVAPDYIHPINCRSINDMVNNIEDDLGIKKLGDLLWQ
jgi:2-amino-4-hydroxy-6-hydroxymethyldihydropteridine diphosphokinase